MNAITTYYGGKVAGLGTKAQPQAQAAQKAMKLGGKGSILCQILTLQAKTKRIFSRRAYG